MTGARRELPEAVPPDPAEATCPGHAMVPDERGTGWGASPWPWFLLAAAALIAITILKDLPGLSTTTIPYLRVFGSFWESGNAARHGLDPFAVYPLTPPAARPGVFDVNLSPPAMLPLFALLARLHPAQWAPVWIVGQAAAFIAGGALLFATTRHRVRFWYPFVLLLAPQINDSVYLGQDYGCLYLIAVAGWIFARGGRHVAAGLAIGLLVAAKPNFGVWPLFLLCAGMWRPALTAALVALATALLPVTLYGFQIYPRWMAAVAANRHWEFASDVSLHGLFSRFGVALAGTAMAALLVLATTALVWRRRVHPMVAGALALLVGILAAPLAWSDYAVFLLPALVDGLWGKSALASVALLTAGSLLQQAAPALASAAYMAGFLCIGTELVRRAGAPRGGRR